MLELFHLLWVKKCFITNHMYQEQALVKLIEWRVRNRGTSHNGTVLYLLWEPNVLRIVIHT
jgi:hypothetical protein